MKRFPILLLLALGSAFAGGCASQTHAESKKGNDEPLIAEVRHYDIGWAVFDAFPAEDTVHLDCLPLGAVSPASEAGKEWNLMIYNEVWEPKIDFGYRSGVRVEIVIPESEISRDELLKYLEAEGPLEQVWVPNDVIKPLEPS